jgi:hypothetical protein
VWGATPLEVAASYPCDALLASPDYVVFRAVDVAASPAVVYRWLCQLRAAPYSYDLLDSPFRPSPRSLTPGLERLEIGARVMTLFRIADFEWGHTLTLRSASRAGDALFGAMAGSYLVTPREGGARLLGVVRVRFGAHPLQRMLRAVVPWIDLVMFRKQLLRLRAFAERDERKRAQEWSERLGHNGY